MITASVKFLNNSLLADLTCRECELYEHLQSVGILTAPSLITLDNARTVQIKLKPTNQTGELINSIINEKKDTLVSLHSSSEINRIISANKSSYLYGFSSDFR